MKSVLDLLTFRGAMFNLFTFVTWTLTSFLCHSLAKTFLTLTQVSGIWVRFTDLNEYGGQFMRACVLTTIQLGLCVIYIQPTQTGSSSKHMTVAMVTHCLASLATNVSMAFMVASSTFAIKLMEPITSAFLQHLVLGTPMTLSTKVSLPLIVTGAIIFTGNPLAVQGTTWGFLAALTSNVVLAFRNISIKQMQCSDQQTKLGLNRRRLGPGLVLFLLVASCLRYLEDNVYGDEMEGLTYIALSGAGSAVFHVAYSYTSTCVVLEKVSVVSHAVANICKRVLVVILLYWIGHRVASPYQWLGFTVCLVGLVVYVWGKRPVTVIDTGTHKASVRGKDFSAFLQDFKSLPSRKASLKYVLLSCGISGIIILAAATFSTISGDNEPFGSYHMPRAIAIDGKKSENVLPDAHDPARGIWRSSFGKSGFKYPAEEELLPTLSSTGIRAPGDSSFLNKRFSKDPTEANLICKELSTSFEIIKESQRLHFNIIGGVLKGFKYVMLFDIAAFENKGDPCITMGEIYYLKRIGLETIYYCDPISCTPHNIAKAAKMANRYNTKELVILLHGGGNIFLYPSRDSLKFHILDIFDGFSIVIFPQSVHVPEAHPKHVKKASYIYCCNPNLTLVTRDRLSFYNAQKLFNGSTKILMAPDMAFQIGQMPRFMSPVFDILWLRRQDSESIGYTVDQDFQGYTVHVSDWLPWHTPSASNSLEKAFYTGTNGFFYLQRGRVVITDRLHGHILSTLMDIPHVILDNKDFKISRYHNTWTKGLENTVMTDDYTKALDLAIGLLKKYNHTLPPTVPYLSVNEYHRQSTFGSPGQTYP